MSRRAHAGRRRPSRGGPIRIALAGALILLAATAAIAVGCGKYGKPVRASERAELQQLLSPQRGEDDAPAPAGDETGEVSR